MSAYGRFDEIEGRGALVFRRELDAPRERVWEAVTTPAGLAAWFPCRLDGDVTAVGSALDFVFPEEDPSGEDATHGVVLAAEPGRRVAFTWEADELRVRLEPLDPDRCVLEFVTLLPPDDVSAAARTAAGWHSCLDALAEHLATGAAAPAPADPTEEFRGLYEAYVAAGFPSGAPVPGDEA